MPTEQPAPIDAKPHDGSLPKDARFVFVQMLFSLTAAEIARQIAELVLNHPLTWDSARVWASLILAAGVVVASWLGWSSSEASRQVKVTSLFDSHFVVLLIDLTLVVMYFLLVRGAALVKEKPHPASAENEAAIVATILALYFAWDVLTKAVIPSNNMTEFFKNLRAEPMSTRGRISLQCMFLGVLPLLFVRWVSTTGGVILVDLCLLCLTLLFRSRKEKKRRWSQAIGGVGLAAGIVSLFV
jgi:hypothetical protein